MNWIHNASGSIANGLFPIIYADPAWSYRQQGRGAAENHYSTMSQADLVALPVDSLAPTNALLFMWATWPNLWEALDLGHRWGFAFKTCAFNWVKLTNTGKPATGMGSYTRANSEPCLLFTRGKAAPLILDHGVNQIVTTHGEAALPTEDVLTVPGRHSAKPPEVRDRIIRLVGEKVASIELFARDPDPRFERWGDQGNETISLLRAA